MAPELKLRYLILKKAVEFGYLLELPPMEETAITDAYETLRENEEHYDPESEIREGEFVTDVPCERSRHYESRSVATKCDDGSWIGWTYWYGGGKHGEPEAVDWIEYAYDLECREEEQTVIVRTFTKVPA